jgi:phenylacetate-CoA ligase
MEDWSWPPAYDDGFVPGDDQEYWFPERETLDPELRDAAILKRIQLLLQYAHERSPFYRRKWAAEGILPGDIRSLADFEQVPVVTKEELRADQAAHPPFGSYLCVPDAEIARVHGTSGTTGRPSAFGIDRRDWRSIANAHARMQWAMGIRPSDMVFIGSVFSLYMGSWGALVGAERLGAAAFPFGAGVPGQTLRAVNWMAQMRPTVFYGTPSYALRLAEVATENGVDTSDLGLRVMFFSGEPGASIPSIRKRIEDAYAAQVFDSGSMAEVTPWMNLSETRARVGPLCWQDVVYTEVVDPDTHQRVPYGGEGTPVYTQLERTSQPMIRLLSGDLTTWERGPSPCGRTYPYLPRGIYGRIDDQFTIRGENINPAAIDEVVSGIAGYGGEHRIIVSRAEAMDTLCVKVEYDATLAGDNGAVSRFGDEVERRLQATLRVRTSVVAVPRGNFERTEFKARRVIDEREELRQFRAHA